MPKEYAQLSMPMETAVVVDSMLKGIMKDPENMTAPYLDTLSREELEKIKADLTISGIEIVKSVLHINELLCNTAKEIG